MFLLFVACTRSRGKEETTFRWSCIACDSQFEAVGVWRCMAPIENWICNATHANFLRNKHSTLYFIDMSDICRKFSYFTCLKSFTMSYFHPCKTLPLRSVQAYKSGLRRRNCWCPSQFVSKRSEGNLIKFEKGRFKEFWREFIWDSIMFFWEFMCSKFFS